MLELTGLAKYRWNIPNLTECFFRDKADRCARETWRFSMAGRRKGPAVRLLATSPAKFEATTSGLRAAVGRTGAARASSLSSKDSFFTHSLLGLLLRACCRSTTLTGVTLPPKTTCRGGCASHCWISRRWWWLLIGFGGGGAPDPGMVLCA